MARAIIRYSLEGTNRLFRTNLGNYLQRNGGLTRTGTSTYETEDQPLEQVVETLHELLARLATADLDHLWIYVDKGFGES